MDLKHALTQLTRRASRYREDVDRIDRALHGRLDALGELAIEVAMETGEPMGEALARAIQAEATPALATRLSAAMPFYSVALTEASVVADKRALSAFAQSGTSGVEVFHVARLRSLAARLDQAGQLAEAAASAEQAVERAREITRGTPQAGELLLAQCLVLSSDLQRKLGRLPQAHDQASEAERLTQASPPPGALQAPDHERIRAASLVNLSIVSAALGAMLPSVDLAEQGERLWRQRAAAGGDADDRESHASALYTLARRYADLARNDAALATARLAAAAYQDLADESSDTIATASVLAHGLLGALLQGPEQAQEAVQVLRVALDMAQRLVRLRPQVHQAALGATAGHLAIALLQAGELEEARQRLADSMAVHRRLAAERPDMFNPRLAVDYHTLARIHQRAGEPDLARQAAGVGMTLLATQFIGTPAVHVHVMDSLAVLNAQGRAVPASALHQVVLQMLARMAQEAESPLPLAFDLGEPLQVVKFLFSELLRAAAGHPHEPALRRAAASAGVHAVTSMPEAAYADERVAIVEQLEALRGLDPADVYLADEFSVALQVHAFALLDAGDEQQALLAHARLRALAALPPGHAQARWLAGDLAISLVGRLEEMTQARAVFEGIWRDAEAFPDDLRTLRCVARCTANLVIRIGQLGDTAGAVGAIDRLQWVVEASQDAEARSHLATAMCKGVMACMASGAPAQAGQLYDRLRALHARFSDEEAMAQCLVDAFASFAIGLTLAGQLDAARLLLSQYRTFMAVERRWRIALIPVEVAVAHAARLAGQPGIAARHLRAAQAAADAEAGDPDIPPWLAVLAAMTSQAPPPGPG